jgi:hypothetical protein
MNVVNTRTNILIFMVVTQEPTIGKCQLLLETKIWENYYHNSKRTSNEMNVVSTRTNILYIHGCHTRTNHKKMSVVTHVNPILESINYHYSKPKFRCQRFLRRSMHGCMRTCNKLSLGACWGSEMSYFHPPFPSLFLTFHRPIKPSSYPFHKYIWVSHYYFPLYSF